MGINTEAIQKLYVAYFNRPADYSGLTYWENALANGSAKLSDISAQFAASNEYKAAYANMDAAHVVAQVYANLFGKTPAQIDSAGLQFWTQALLTKAMTIDNVVTSIAAGAVGPDGKPNADGLVYANKVAAATAFTAALDTPEKQLAYSGDAANGVAKTFIGGITDKASLDAAISTGNLGSVIADVVNNAPVVLGTTYTLTAGMDTFPGTAGNDTFNAYIINPTTGAAATNLSSFDTLDGSAGKDTLNIQLDATSGNSLTGTIKNIEIINISATAATAVDASIFQGATNINQIGTAGDVTNLGTGTTAGYNGKTIGGLLKVGATGSSAAVSFTNVAETASLAVSGSKLASVSVSGTRFDTDNSGALATLALGVTVGKDVQTVSINTNQTTAVTLTEDAASTKHVTTVDASASTGGVTYDETAAGAVLAANVSTGAGKDTVKVNVVTAAATAAAAAVNSTISTGAGNDTIVVANTGNGLTTVDGGAGDDTITVTKLTGAGLSVTGGDGNDTIVLQGNALETTDVIDGGAGTDVVSLAGKAARVADDYIVLNKLLKNFEGIKFSTAETALDATKLAANYTSIDLFTGSAITGVTTQAITANGNVGLTASGYDATDPANIVYAGNLAVTEKATGTVTANADVLTLTVKAASAGNVAATVAGDVQTAAITLTNTVNSTSNPTIDRVASVTVDNTATDAALKSLTLSGNGSATVVNAGGKLVSVDASALGGTYTVAGTTTVGLNYTSSNAKAETIKLGSGIDSVTLNASTYGKMDTITGLNLVANSAGTALTATSDTLTVAGATAAVKFTTTQTDLDLALKDAAAANAGKTVVFQMGGDTYVYHDGGTAGSVDALDVLVKLTGAINLDALVLALH